MKAYINGDINGIKTISITPPGVLIEDEIIELLLNGHVSLLDYGISNDNIIFKINRLLPEISFLAPLQDSKYEIDNNYPFMLINER